jgi:hypothetical protein
MVTHRGHFGSTADCPERALDNRMHACASSYIAAALIQITKQRGAMLNFRSIHYKHILNKFAIKFGRPAPVNKEGVAVRFQLNSTRPKLGLTPRVHPALSRPINLLAISTTARRP